MQTFLLPLPASPETGEELTAFARKSFLPLFLYVAKQWPVRPFFIVSKTDLHFWLNIAIFAFKGCPWRV
jgi:hypothetical protein